MEKTPWVDDTNEKRPLLFGKQRAFGQHLAFIICLRSWRWGL